MSEIIYYPDKDIFCCGETTVTTLELHHNVMRRQINLYIWKMQNSILLWMMKASQFDEDMINIHRKSNVQ